MFWKIGAEFYRRTDTKMTLWYILTLLVSLVIIGSFLYVRLSHQLVKEVDRFLLDETEELAAVLSQNPREPEALKKFEKRVTVRRRYPLFFQIVSETGGVLYSSKGFGEISYKLNPRVWVNARNGKETRENIRSSKGYRSPRLISTPIRVDGGVTYVIQMGTPLRFVKKSVYNFKENILTILPILLLLGSLGGWFLARKSLSPIGYIVSKTRNITSTNLGERLIPRGTDDEMDDLILTINEMISRLEGSFKRMAEFTADASHELKTPICAMRGEIEVLLLEKSTVEEYQEVLTRLIERFDHLNRMINDLILLSKFDTSQTELTMAPLRLDLLIKDICNLFQALAEQRKISLEMDTLPEAMVIGDKVRLQQLFSNLIDNAIKYAPEGSVRITLEKDRDWVQARVKDTGIGISQEEQGNIFKRFYRVDKSRSRETGGAGLGLSIADWIAHAHRGRIEVDSELGQGSTFTLSLPLQKA